PVKPLRGPMKIADVRLTGLAGGTVEGGWAEELVPDDNIHTVVEVVTDGGLVGVGSAYTSRALVEGGVKLLRPPLIGERADEPLREKLKAAVARGFKAIKLGWKPFGRRDAKTDELLVRTARETVGPGVELMVDAGGSDAFWPHGYKWALRTAQMLAAYDVVWF